MIRRRAYLILIGTGFLALAALAFFIFVARTTVTEEALTVPTRPGVTVPCLLVQNPKIPPGRFLLLLCGHYGKVELAPKSGVANFLVRSRALFTVGDTSAVVVDTPSDQPGGIGLDFRMGPEHATDLGAVMDFLRGRFPSARSFYLVGTSWGTVSAACAGRRLQDRLAGIVLTSVCTERIPLEATFKGLRPPVLLVHHSQDRCEESPFGRAKGLAQTYNYPLVQVDGGKKPVTGSCDAGSAHGFYGKEAATVEQILRWVRGEAIAAQT
jgi:alpha/beta superfamily hydrolase